MYNFSNKSCVLSCTFWNILSWWYIPEEALTEKINVAKYFTYFT